MDGSRHRRLARRRDGGVKRGFQSVTGNCDPRAGKRELKHARTCCDCQLHHSSCPTGAGGGAGEKDLRAAVNEVCSARRRAPHYVECGGGTKSREPVDYLFDVSLKPGGRGKTGTRTVGGWRKKGGKEGGNGVVTNVE